MTGLSTPAFLVDAEGVVVFYNDAAGSLLGRRFEEGGQLPPERWGTEFGPLDKNDKPIPWDELPLTIALRDNRPALGRFHIRALDGRQHEIHVTAIPIVTMSGTHGAMAIFWSIDDEEG